MKKKGLIIFDFDGVIVDSIPLLFEYSKKTLPFLNWKMYQEVSDSPHYIGAINLYRRSFGKKISKTLKDKRSEYTIKKAETTALVEGMDTLLKNLSSKYELALNTNAGYQNTFPLLKKYNIQKYFSTIKTRDDSVYKTEKSLQILEELDIEPKNTLFVTDSYRDVVYAREAGIKSIGVLTGIHMRKHFEQGSVRDDVVCIASNTKEIEDGIDSYFRNEKK